MSLKLGVWKINENGAEGTFDILNVNPETGEVSGQIYGDLTGPFAGVFDETSRTITFVCQGQPMIFAPRLFKGILFSTPRNPAPGQDVVWTLAGFVQFTDLGGAGHMGGNARRTVFGWFAQITEVG